MRISDWSSDVCSSDLSIVDRERLTRMQGLLAENGIHLSKRQIAMDQNGDLSLNLTPETAAAMWKAGLINESQLGAIADGGHARFSFAHNDLLVSSGTDFSRSARSDKIGRAACRERVCQ